MSMPLSRIARGSTCSNLSRRIWRCISHRRLASCAYAGRTCNRTIASVIRNRIEFPCYGVSHLYIRLHQAADFGRPYTVAKPRLAHTHDMNLHMLLARSLATAIFVTAAGLAARPDRAGRRRLITTPRATSGGCRRRRRKARSRSTAGSTSRRGRRRRWPTDFVQNDPREGEPATYDTEVRLLYDDRALYIGVFAKDPEPGADHRQRAAQGLQHRHRRRLPGRHRHVPRRAQRLPVRDQPGRREVGLADVQRGPRPERRTGTASGTSARASARTAGMRRSRFRSRR